MSIFTPVAREECAKLLESYNLGTLQEFFQIPSGISNSNFKVVTTEQRAILTVFERLTSPATLFPYLQFVLHLSEQGFPCSAPFLNREEKPFVQIRGKPAVFMEFIPGDQVTQPTETTMRSLGEMVAKLHLASASFQGPYPKDRYDSSWQYNYLYRISLKATPEERRWLQSEWVTQDFPVLLPASMIHGDLFRENMRVEGDEIRGIFDFYSAFYGPWILDVLTVLCDWCFDEKGFFNEALARLFLETYNAVRAFTPDERELFLPALRQRALRFYLSRRHDEIFLSGRKGVVIRDPQFFGNILRFCRANPEAITALLD